MKTISFFITNHGYGHAMRNAPIIAHILSVSSYSVLLVSDKPQLTLAIKTVRKYVSKEVDLEKRLFVIEDKLDYGTCVIPGTLKLDVDLLYEGVVNYIDKWKTYEGKYLDIIKHYNVKLVVADIVPWVLSLANKMSIPSFLMVSFTWCDIYREHLSLQIVKNFENAYLLADKVFFYDLANPISKEMFIKGENIGLVSRPFDEKRINEIREQYEKPIVFMSLGGSTEGINETIDVSGIPYIFITTGKVHLSGNNVVKLPLDCDETHNYLAASDFVISKPGWSTMAEVLISGRPVALIARDEIAEDRYTVNEMVCRGAAIKITEEDLRSLEEVIEKMKISKWSKKRYFNSIETIAVKLMRIIEES